MNGVCCLLMYGLTLPVFISSNVRMMFKNGQWEEGKRLLDEGLRYYTDTNDLNELNGRYYYHMKDYDNARYYLVVACRDNPENVTAKQLLVTVEEVTKNYSSAICYINELLEINPYWKGLWRKKIGLFPNVFQFQNIGQQQDQYDNPDGDKNVQHTGFPPYPLQNSQAQVPAFRRFFFS